MTAWSTRSWCVRASERQKERDRERKIEKRERKKRTLKRKRYTEDIQRAGTDASIADGGRSGRLGVHRLTIALATIRPALGTIRPALGTIRPALGTVRPWAADGGGGRGTLRSLSAA